MEKSRKRCIRCGACCLSAAPSLQFSDIACVTEGPIKKSDLYTLRVGERVRDNIHGGLKTTKREIIKIREREDSGACIFYHEPARRCTIYEHRPVQCSAMKCWDEREFVRVYEEPKADRSALIHDSRLLRLMVAHEERCGYARLDRHVREIETNGEKAVEKILGILKFDHDIRVLAPERLDVDARELDLVFGRPLTETIAMFGLKVVREPDGSFLLTLGDAPPQP